MHRFFRWYNENREVFFIIIAIIVFFLLIIQVLNSIVARQEEEKRNSMTQQNTTVNNTINSEPNTSVITGEEITQTEATIAANAIKQFVNYCNNKQIENAYNMLTEECKTLIYPSLESFTENYYNRIFYINRMYNLENWYDDADLYTYYIKYTEDVLASGNLNSEDNKGDYITVVIDEEGYKLNISSYVGRRIIDQQEGARGVNIKINWIDMYMDYAIANISAQNNTGGTICIDAKDGSYTTYMYDENNVKYNSLLHENAEEQLMVRKNLTNTINIKFNKMYNTNREIMGIIFSNIVTNYDEYRAGTSDKKTITINFEF